MAIPDDKLEEQTEKMREFGQELERRRLAAGYHTGGSFAKVIGIGPGHLSNIEKAYSKQGTAPSVPKIETINRISEALKWPKIEMLMIMGYMDEKDLEAPVPRRFKPKRTLDSYEDFRDQYFWLTEEEAQLHWNAIVSRKPQESTKN